VKLLFENWREYLNEGLNYRDYYMKIDPRRDSQDVEYCMRRECEVYGEIEWHGKIILIRTSDNEAIMSFHVQSYTGYISHNKVKEYEKKCAYEYDDDCVTMAIEDNGLPRVQEKIYSGSWYLHEDISSKYVAGTVAIAFCESVIALLRHGLNAKYFGYHQVVDPNAYTSKNAIKLAQYAVKKGFLEDVIGDFLPTDDNPEEYDDYQVYEITDIAKKRFVIKK